ARPCHRPMNAQPPEQPIPFVTVTSWVRAARLCGIDIEAIFRAEGIDTSRLHPEQAFVERLALQRVMRRCVEETLRVGSPLHFPIVLGDTFAFEYMPDVETFITTSASLRDAARALEWIPPLLNPYLSFVVSELGAEARIALEFKALPESGPDIVWPFTEGVLATTLKFARMLMGPDPTVNRITMRHARHAQAELVEAHFQAPVEWGAPLDAIWFDRALLDRPLAGAFPVLH